MPQGIAARPILAGSLLAIIATIIWSGNFIVARGAMHKVPPVTLATLRWGCASLIMLPLGWAAFRADWPVIRRHPGHIALAALTGVTVFNTLVYIAAHQTSAINLALIGTTSSPVMSFILARIFLHEPIPPRRLLGLGVCVAGILLLISRGSWEVLAHFRFTPGDLWILAGAFAFAVYNIVVRKKPAGISPRSYLLVTFVVGTLMLLPFALREQPSSLAWHLDPALAGMVLYLGAGASVAAFFCWNGAIARLGASRAAIFGNLIPIFASIEAVLILQEKITWIHYLSMAIVTAGLIIANLKPRRKTPH